MAAKSQYAASLADATAAFKSGKGPTLPGTHVTETVQQLRLLAKLVADLIVGHKEAKSASTLSGLEKDVSQSATLVLAALQTLGVHRTSPTEGADVGNHVIAILDYLQVYDESEKSNRRAINQMAKTMALNLRNVIAHLELLKDADRLLHHDGSTHVIDHLHHTDSAGSGLSGAGAAPSESGSYSDPPASIWEAAMDEDYDIGTRVEIIEDLAAEGMDPNQGQPLTGTTALHFAAKEDEMLLAQSLILLGADVNVKNIAGETPLAVAEANSAAQVAMLLSEFGGTK